LGYQTQIEATRNLLSGLEFGTSADLTTYLALKTRLPPEAQLFSYDANVFRDWCWGKRENEISIKAVTEILNGDTPQRLLILGSGAGRLAYDLHQQLGPELTVALDMNPLLATVSRKLFDGADVNLVEFPRAPIDASSVALPRTLQAPGPAADGLEVVLADAMRPPFVPGSFDLVVTPWLIDVVDVPPAEFLQRLNPLLEKDGCWIHHGSLAFTHADPLDRPDLIELKALAERNGFGDLASDEVTAPYLDSPVSRHARRESIVTLRARKAADIGELPRYQSLPDWLAKGRTPIPLLPAFQTQAMSTRIHAFIMTLVDGKRSLMDIAALLEEQQLMPKADAEIAIRGFLIKMFEEAVQRGR
jgi:SAM-dependent methyltransferase